MKIQLAGDEQIIATMHRHPRCLVWPMLWLFAIAGASGVSMALLPAWHHAVTTKILIGVAILLILLLVIRPLLKWLSVKLILTDKRMVRKNGFFNPELVQVNFSRIVDVAYATTYGQRMFGCGTLKLKTVTGRQIKFLEVPQIADVAELIAAIIHDVDSSQFVSDYEDSYRQSYNRGYGDNYQASYDEPGAEHTRRFDDYESSDETLYYEPTRLDLEN